MSSFFSTPASQRKRKRQDTSSTGTSKRHGRPHNPASRKAIRTTNPETTRNPRKAASARVPRDDESISGSDYSEPDSNLAPDTDLTASDSEDDDGDDRDETAAERRLKLAERYLENIRAELGDGNEIGFDAKDIDRDLVASRLKQDVDEEQGKIYHHIADELDYEKAQHTFFRADTLAATGVAVCAPFVYIVSKDATLIKWQVSAPLHHHDETHHPSINGTKSIPVRRKPRQLKYVNCRRLKRPTSKQAAEKLHTDSILCVAASASGKFVVTGGADKKLIIWDAATLRPLKVFTQHRDAVTSLAFRGKTHQLFSGSKDRTIKVWSLDELAYVETLFGHLDEVVDIAAVGGTQERCVSVGARDRSARLWKVAEESQLVFRGGGQSSRTGGGGGEKRKNHEHPSNAAINNNRQTKTNGAEQNHHAAIVAADPSFPENSLDRVIQPSTNLFITGSDSGALSLYALHRKKALEVITLAHGYEPPPDFSSWSAEKDPSEEKIASIMKHGGPQPSPRWITALACLPGSDLVVSGSWDGHVRVWRISADQRHFEPVAILGSCSSSSSFSFSSSSMPPSIPNSLANNNNNNNNDRQSSDPPVGGSGRFKGVINDLAVFERGERGKEGISIVVAVGSEPRLGRWITTTTTATATTTTTTTKKKKGPGVKNGAFIIDVPRHVLVNGTGTSTDIGAMKVAS